VTGISDVQLLHYQRQLADEYEIVSKLYKDYDSCQCGLGSISFKEFFTRNELVSYKKGLEDKIKRIKCRLQRHVERIESILDEVTRIIESGHESDLAWDIVNGRPPTPHIWES
jgi:hypothetical protein